MQYANKSTDEMEGDTVIKEKIHFDINYQNIIVGQTKGELRKRIANRIRATIL
jgi:hypothetical protein